MQKLLSEVRAGERVQARGEAWLVVQHDTFDDCALVTLRGAGDLNLGETARLLSPFDHISRPPHAPRIARRPRHTVLAAAAQAVARGHGWTDAWTAATARIDLHPWQLEPALAVIGGATRVLLADEVGLGKTIQAGLILSELRARSLATRALILTPASLREQWASELDERFKLAPMIVDHAALAGLVADLPVGVNPWGLADLVISSIDLVKRPEVRAAVDAVSFDALVIDEAHHLCPGTDRAAVAADLASRVPWVVLATATPHSGDARAYALLGGLGQLAPDEPLAVFRRSAADIGRPRARQVRFLGVAATAAERALFDETLAYSRAVWRQHHHVPQAAVIASVICRRAVSSAHAVLRTLERRRDLLGLTAPAPVWQPDLPWAEYDAADGVEGDEILGVAGLTDRDREIEWLDRLIGLAREGRPSCSKAAVIERLLRRTREPALVFSEYRDTISDLEQRLASGASVVVLHGGLTARERRAAVQSFTTGLARVLLATDAAGEGLNLHARCRLVLNVELPWNPLRLEQRIGRVDRIGQTRRVHALHLFHRGSFEDEVLARLHKRMETIDEQRVAAAVFGGVAVPEGCTTVPSAHVATAAANGAGTIALRRRALPFAASRLVVTSPMCAAPAGRHRGTGRWALAFEVMIHDGGGRLVARDVLPLAIAFGHRLPVHRAGVCRWCEVLASSPGVRAILDRELERRLASTRAELGTTAESVERRLSLLAAGIERAGPALIQTSLFDKRAERQARASDLTTDARRTYVQQRLAAIRMLTERDLSARAHLVAAWPWEE